MVIIIRHKNIEMHIFTRLTIFHGGAPHWHPFGVIFCSILILRLKKYEISTFCGDWVMRFTTDLFIQHNHQQLLFR